MAIVKNVLAREILDSRGNPTVEVDITLSSGAIGRAAVPSGASTGMFEALELRDDDSSRYNGKGVLKAVSLVNDTLYKAIVNRSFSTQEELDDFMIELDGTENKSKLGANTILGISLAFAVACSRENNHPLFESLSISKSMCLPTPMMNIINGGAHADNNVDFQEFMIIPAGFSTFTDSLRAGVEVFHALKALLQRKGLSTAVGDEGGFAPNLRSNIEAIDLILQAVYDTGFSEGKIYLALDVASSEFYKSGNYQLASENKRLDDKGLIALYEQLIVDYPIISIEDGLAENDWKGWQLLTEKLGRRVQLVGDDLFVTNPSLLSKGIEQKIANAILVKLNQIGTLTETIRALNIADKAGFNAVISHRSGETEDTFIADLAVSCGCGQIKTGSLCRSDRTAKYNQLLRIESEYDIPFAGLAPFKRFLDH